MFQLIQLIVLGNGVIIDNEQYMRELSLQECKQIEVEILDHIHSVCKQHNLRYSLGYGTLLGAIRHKGFIPWDDDIDIIMPRNDYDQLLQVLGQNPNDTYILHTPACGDYFYEFAKVSKANTLLVENNLLPIENYGVYVDIFPIDNIPCCFRVNRIKMRLLHRFRTASVYTSCPPSPAVLKPVAWLVWKVARKIGYKTFVKAQQQLIRKTTQQPQDKLMFYASSNGCTYHKNLFDNLIETDFEGKRYSIIAEYDDYLTIEYGDYMQLPPKEKQISNHNYIAYLKN